MLTAGYCQKQRSYTDDDDDNDDDDDYDDNLVCKFGIPHLQIWTETKEEKSLKKTTNYFNSLPVFKATLQMRAPWNLALC